MKVLFFILFFACQLVVLGKMQTEVFVNYNTGNNMLKHNTVETITRDMHGYVWIGTNYGLYRLDGYQVQSYIADATDSSSLSNNFIKTLYTDSDNELWIGTIGGGLLKFNREKNSFERLFSSNKAYIAKYENITALTGDFNNNIWIGTSRDEVVRFNKKTGEFNIVELFKYDPYNRTNSNVNVLLTDSSGNIWVGLNQSEVFRIKAKTLHVTYFGLSLNDPNYSSIGSIKGMSQTNDGTILIVTWNGSLYRINPKIDTAMQLWKGPDFFNKSLLSDVKVDKNNNIWISSWEKGLFKIDYQTGLLNNITRDLSRVNSLGSNALNKLYIDNNENLWISTLENGLSMLPLKEKMFKTLDFKTDDGTSVKEINVYAIVKDQQGILWIGTRGQGLWEYNPQTGVTKNYRTEENSGLNSNSILHLRIGLNNKIWIATDGRFVTEFDPLTKKFLPIINKNNDWSSGAFATAEDEHFVWVGTWGGGIKKIDKLTRNYSSINFDEKDQFKNSVFDVELTDSILWVANVGLGLIKFNTLTGNYKVYSDTKNDRTIPKERITDIYLENKNSLWISTDGGGLFNFIPSEERFYSMTNEYELVSNVVQASITDNSGNIWLASNSGISHINTNLKRIFNFNKHNGLVTNQLNKSALCFDPKENLIYVGGVEGVNYFSPTTIVIDSTVNNIVFTNISIMGNSISTPNYKNIHKAIDVAKEINLYPNEKIISIYFSAMEFIPSVKSRYYYMLEGFDKEWVESPYNKNYVQYTNLDPGDYLLRIKACNSDGICGQNESSIKIIVHPAFWQTLLFQISLVLFVLAIVYFYVRNKYKNLENAKQILERKVNERTEEIQFQKQKIEKQNQELELANHTKDKFFSIISHDLKNPMASINQLIQIIIEQYDDLTEEQLLLYLNSLKKSSKLSIELLDDLLVWARTQTNRIKIEKQPIAISELFSEVKNICLPLALNKNIELQFPSNASQIIAIDKNTIMTVLRNLVTNAIKYSKSGYFVVVSIDENETEFIIGVIDQGLGMSKADVSKLFKIENLVSKRGTSGESGTGLGLVLCYEFLNLNGEKIWIESELGKGTKVFFTLQKNS